MLLAPGRFSLWCSRPVTHHLDHWYSPSLQARYGLNLFPFSCSLSLLLLFLFFVQPLGRSINCHRGHKTSFPNKFEFFTCNHLNKLLCSSQGAVYFFLHANCPVSFPNASDICISIIQPPLPFLTLTALKDFLNGKLFRTCGALKKRQEVI